MAAAVPVDAPLLAVLLLATATSVLLALSTRARQRSREFVVDYGVFAVFAFFAIAGIWLFVDPRYDQEYLRTMLQQYGLAALFAIFVLEGAMLLYFAPSESLVPAAVVLLGSSLPDIALIIAVSVVGATAGQYALFLVAKRGGREYLLEARWFRVSEDRLDRFDAWFERWGPLVVPTSNTLLFTRGMLTVPAGLAMMDDRRFVALSAAGTLVFQSVLAALTLGVLELV